METNQRQSSFLWEGNTLEIHLPIIFNTMEVSKDWNRFLDHLKKDTPRNISIHANDLREADSSGISFLKLVRLECESRKIQFTLFGLDEKFQYRLNITNDDSKKYKEQLADALRKSEQIGKLTIDSLLEFKYLVTFTGELTVSFWRSFLHPSKIRWKDSFRVAESMGVNAFPIIAMIGFLLGLIMSFQSAIPMRRFGAEIFVANLVGLSLFRELGPLMTVFLFYRDDRDLRLRQNLEPRKFRKRLMHSQPWAFLLCSFSSSRGLLHPLSSRHYSLSYSICLV